MGQHHPVTVYSYVCSGTIEERIEEILREKQQLFDDVIDGGPGAVMGPLTSAEVFGLFGLKPPA